MTDKEFDLDTTETEEDWRPPIRFDDSDDISDTEQDSTAVGQPASTEPTTPDEPTESANLTEPTEPTDPTEPTEPTDPTDPTEPTEPVAAPVEDKRKRIRTGEKKKTSIGGQALIEGVMMRGPHRTVMAIRNSDGKIVIEEVRSTKKDSFIKKIPIVRGVVGFVESMLLGTKTITRSAELSGMDLEEDELSPFEKKLEKALGGKLMNVIMGIASVLAIVLAVVLFVWLPAALYSGLGWLMERFLPDSGATFVMFSDESAWKNIIRSAFEGVLKIGVFITYVALVSKMKEIRRVFEYHGAEHKTIFCYEAGEELTVENVRKFKRFHPRCGTSFLILMLILGIVAGMFIQLDNTILRALIKLACIPLIMGVGYELLKLCGRYDNFLTRIIAAPGMWMQRLTTKEPDDGQIECAIESLIEVIPENQEDDRW